MDYCFYLIILQFVSSTIANIFLLSWAILSFHKCNKILLSTNLFCSFYAVLFDWSVCLTFQYCCPILFLQVVATTTYKWNELLMRVNDSFEFLKFVNSHNARTLLLSPDGTCSELTNSADELSDFIADLIAENYLKRYSPCGKAPGTAWYIFIWCHSLYYEWRNHRTISRRLSISKLFNFRIKSWK